MNLVVPCAPRGPPRTSLLKDSVASVPFIFVACSLPADGGVLLPSAGSLLDLRWRQSVLELFGHLRGGQAAADGRCARGRFSLSLLLVGCSWWCEKKAQTTSQILEVILGDARGQAHAAPHAALEGNPGAVHGEQAQARHGGRLACPQVAPRAAPQPAISNAALRLGRRGRVAPDDTRVACTWRCPRVRVCAGMGSKDFFLHKQKKGGGTHSRDSG